MKRSTVIALTLIVCGVMIAGAGAFAQQASDPSGAANGATDSTLEIAPNYPQPSSTPQPDSSDAGTAQDYAGSQGSDAAPLPEVAGINDYMNQEATYEAVSTGLPPIALLPPPAYYPYYYPGFYPRFYGPPPVHRPPPPHRLPPPAYHPFFGPSPRHGGFQHR